MATTTEKLVVESVTQYGFRANGVNYSLSPRLKEKNITPDAFKKGAEYLVEVWVGPKGGHSINGFQLVGEGSPIPPVPSIPVTSVANTPAPGGIPPVAPTAKHFNGNGLISNGNGKAADPDKMSKADWAAKDRTIELQAILKSTIESPGIAQLIVGKNDDEALAAYAKAYSFFVALYDEKKAS